MPYLGGFEHLAPPERQRGGRERLAGFIDHNVATRAVRRTDGEAVGSLLPFRGPQRRGEPVW